MSRRRKKKSKDVRDIAQNVAPSYEQIVRDVVMYQQAIKDVPALVRKSWKQLPNADARRGPQTWFHDPLSLQYSIGYKDRRFSITYDTLKRISGQLSIISAIVNTRCSQVAAFSQPYRWTKSLGFTIRHKDPEHVTTPAELKFIKELEDFVMRCGRAEPNPYSRVKRDDFEGWLRKVVRDSLIYDQLTSEIIYDNVGLPYEWYATDAATVRIAADDRYVGVNSSWHDRHGFVPSMPNRFGGMWHNQEYGQRAEDPVSYVQVINGQIENAYSDRSLIFGVRNPRTDIYIQGYGWSELEQLVTIVTSHLFAEQYNQNKFTNGSIPRGLLNLKGDNFDQEQLEGFKRQWLSQAQGVENAHRVPVFQSEGLEWVDLDKSNAEMEFSKWMEYLIRISSAVYLIDPSEINFDLGSATHSAPMFESSQEWKIKASRDKGLKPLLKFLAKTINENIIDRLDDHFMLEFVGLDELSEQEKHEMLVEQISSYMTLNEARRTLDLPDLPGGDVPMNPAYFNALEVQGLAQGGEGEGGGSAGPSGALATSDKGNPDNSGGQPGPGGQGGVKPSSPKYSGNFGFDSKEAEATQ